MRGTTIRRRFRRPLGECEPLSVALPVGPTRIACQLALAHHIEGLIEGGKVRDYSEAAKQLGLTRARLTQIANLLLLAPWLQEGILCGDLRLAERSLRQVTKFADWQCQLDGVGNTNLRLDSGSASI